MRNNPLPVVILVPVLLLSALVTLAHLTTRATPPPTEVSVPLQIVEVTRIVTVETTKLMTIEVTPVPKGITVTVVNGWTIIGGGGIAYLGKGESRDYDGIRLEHGYYEDEFRQVFTLKEEPKSRLQAWKSTIYSSKNATTIEWLDKTGAHKMEVPCTEECVVQIESDFQIINVRIVQGVPLNTMFGVVVVDK